MVGVSRGSRRPRAARGRSGCRTCAVEDDQARAMAQARSGRVQGDKKKRPDMLAKQVQGQTLWVIRRCKKWSGMARFRVIQRCSGCKANWSRLRGHNATLWKLDTAKPCWFHT